MVFGTFAQNQYFGAALEKLVSILFGGWDEMMIFCYWRQFCDKSTVDSQLSTFIPNVAVTFIFNFKSAPSSEND